MDYNSLMKRVDKIDEIVEFSSAEIFQQRGTMIGRWIGFVSGVVMALVIIVFLTA